MMMMMMMIWKREQLNCGELNRQYCVNGIHNLPTRRAPEREGGSERWSDYYRGMIELKTKGEQD